MNTEASITVKSKSAELMQNKPEPQPYLISSYGCII